QSQRPVETALRATLYRQPMHELPVDSWSQYGHVPYPPPDTDPQFVSPREVNRAVQQQLLRRRDQRGHATHRGLARRPPDLPLVPGERMPRGEQCTVKLEHHSALAVAKLWKVMVPGTAGTECRARARRAGDPPRISK